MSVNSFRLQEVTLNWTYIHINTPNTDTCTLMKKITSLIGQNKISRRPVLRATHPAIKLNFPFTG